MTDGKLVKAIQPKHYPSAGQLLADAFYDNPAHIYMCPEDEKRRADMAWLLGTNLRLQMKHGANSFCLDNDQGKVMAMGFWNRPNVIKVGLLQKLAGGLLKVPFKMGWTNFTKVMEASDGIDAQLAKVFGKEDFWYLNNMVIQGDLQGKGLGSNILKHQFEMLKNIGAPTTLGLSTQRFWTVRFYQRLGFEVLLEEKIGKGKLAFTNWVMRKHL